MKMLYITNQPEEFGDLFLSFDFENAQVNCAGELYPKSWRQTDDVLSKEKEKSWNSLYFPNWWDNNEAEDK